MRYRLVLAWSIVIAASVLLFGASYLPILDPPQCPGHFTQAQVDNANCIVGANIGGALVKMLAVLLAVVGGAGMLASVAVGVARGLLRRSTG